MACNEKFLSTLSLRRATDTQRHSIEIRRISIHALLAESDRRYIGRKSDKNRFLSTLSLRRATQSCEAWEMTIKISIHALLAESDKLSNIVSPCFWISIHALLAESDAASRGLRFPPLDFYPRSPCGERLNDRDNVRRHRQFLSTLSLRRATHESADGMY